MTLHCQRPTRKDRPHWGGCLDLQLQAHVWKDNGGVMQLRRPRGGSTGCAGSLARSAASGPAQVLARNGDRVVVSALSGRSHKFVPRARRYMRVRELQRGVHHLGSAAFTGNGWLRVPKRVLFGALRALRGLKHVQVPGQALHPSRKSDVRRVAHPADAGATMNTTQVIGAT